MNKVPYNSVELQYRISEQVNKKQDRVPLERLAYITCYLFINSAKKNYKWNIMESLTKEYINHSNVAFLENISVEELNNMIEKAKQDTIDSAAVDRETEKMSERVDQMLRKDGMDMDVINECIKNGQPLPNDIADSIIRREVAKRSSSNTNLKVKEKVKEILAEREESKKLFDSEESLDGGQSIMDNKDNISDTLKKMNIDIGIINNATNKSIEKSNSTQEATP